MHRLNLSRVFLLINLLVLLNVFYVAIASAPSSSYDEHDDDHSGSKDHTNIASTENDMVLPETHETDSSDTIQVNTDGTIENTVPYTDEVHYSSSSSPTPSDDGEPPSFESSSSSITSSSVSKNDENNVHTSFDQGNEPSVEAILPSVVSDEEPLISSKVKEADTSLLTDDTSFVIPSPSPSSAATSVDASLPEESIGTPLSEPPAVTGMASVHTADDISSIVSSSSSATSTRDGPTDVPSHDVSPATEPITTPTESPSPIPSPTPLPRTRTPEEEALREIQRAKLQQALVLFQEAEQYRLRIHSTSSTLSSLENSKKALIFYREAAAIGVGPGSSNALYTLARMYEIGWDGGKEITHVASISSDYSYTTSYPWMNRLLKLLNLSGKSYRVPRLYTPSSTDSTVSSINYENYGILVYPNITQSIDYYKQSAALGNAEAQFTLGVLHAYGLFGVDSNESKAITNYYFSSLGGSLDAQIVLSHRHTFGHGVPRSCPAAVVYLEEPAQKALKLVDDSYGLLTYMPQSYIDRLSDDALESITADSNALRAKRNKFLSSSSSTTTTLDTPNDHDRNENSIDSSAGTTSGDNTVVSYYHNAADKGAVEAAVALGHLYLLGARGVTQNLAAAAEQFHNAAEKHDLLSMSVLGFMYLHGIGVTKDPATAAAFLAVPVQANFGVALNTLGYMHLHGIGVRKDAEEGYRLIRKAALEAGSLDALYNLGLLHLQGVNENINGITKVVAERNFQSAAEHFRNAAIQGHIQASVKLGTMQALGMGVVKSCESALSNLRNGIVRVPSAFPVLENAYHALTAGNVPSALLEYARAAEMGLDTGAWNAAYLLDEGLVPEAVPYPKRNITVPGTISSSTASTTVYAYPPEAFLVEPAKQYQSTDTGSDRFSLSSYAVNHPSSSSMDNANDSTMDAVLTLLSEPWYALLHAVTPDGLQTSTPIEQRTLRFYLRSTGFSNGIAQLRIGDYHYYGRAGLPKDPAAAAERYRSACQLHIPEACFNLGTMYERGDGVDTDIHLAKRYYDLTIEEQKQYRGLLLSSGGTSSSIQTGLQSISVTPAKIMLYRLANRKLIFRIRNQFIVPIIEWFEIPSFYLEIIDSWLGIPLGNTVITEEMDPNSVPKDKDTAVPGKSQGAIPSPVTATPSSTTPTTLPTPTSTYPQDKVRDAINKHKAARNAKKRSDSWFGSLFGGGQGHNGGADDQGFVMNTVNHVSNGLDIIIEYFGNIAHTMVLTTGKVIGVVEDLETLTKEDSLMIILACILVVIVYVRSRRQRLHRLRLRQQQVAVPPGAGGGLAAMG